MLHWLGHYVVTLFWSWFGLVIAIVGVVQTFEWIRGKTFTVSFSTKMVLGLVLLFVTQGAAYKTLEEELERLRVVPVPELKIQYDGNELDNKTVELKEVSGSSPQLFGFWLGPFELREGGKAPIQAAVARLHLSQGEMWPRGGPGWIAERSDDSKYPTVLKLNVGPILRGDKVTIYSSEIDGREVAPNINAMLEVNYGSPIRATATFKISAAKTSAA